MNYVPRELEGQGVDTRRQHTGCLGPGGRNISPTDLCPRYSLQGDNTMFFLVNILDTISKQKIG